MISLELLFVVDLISEGMNMSWAQKLKQKVRELKKQTQILMIAYKDKRTPLLAKIVIGISVAYLLSPIDLIPDFIPVLGLLDDLLIVPALILLSIKLIPKPVLNDAKNELEINPGLLKKSNWAFAIVIILIWIVVLCFILKKIDVIKW